MNQLTIQDVTYKDYPFQPFSSESSTEEIDIIEFLDTSFFVWTRQPRFIKTPSFYKTLWPWFDIDLSSIQSRFRIKNCLTIIEETAAKTIDKEITEDEITLEMVEHDFIVRMPPKRRYTIELEVTNIRKGKPRFIEPEQI